MDIGALLIGFGLGVAGAAAVSYVISVRALARVREAQRRAQAAERLAEIGSMTGGLAHEIKNPLSTIALNAGLLVESIQDLEVPEFERSRLVNRTRALRRETDRLADILKDFLEYAGQIHLERRAIDLNELIAELIDFYAPEAERHGVRLRRQATAAAIVASVDSQRLKQALLNLMINATQAMTMPRDAAPPLGEKELILRLERARAPELPGSPSVARLHVIDTGPGIPPEALTRIFNPYFTTKPGGSGLGLPMSRRLVEAHGGRLDVHSEPGKGSDFTLTIPLEGVASSTPIKGA